MTLEISPDLHSHEQEDAVLEHELQRAPVEPLGDARLRREPACPVVARVEARDDDGEHPGCPDELSGNERDERHSERDGGVQKRIGDLRAHPDREESDGEPDRRGHGYSEEEVTSDIPERDSGCRGGDRRPQQNQRGRIVDQALALHDRHQSRRKSELLAQRRCRDRVGGADDRADRDGRRQ